MFDTGRWLRAIHVMETGTPEGRLEAVGDAERALGPCQFHPAAFWDWSDKPRLGMTWREWFDQAAGNFADAWQQAYPASGPGECAMVFHLHCYICRATTGELQENADYLDDFVKVWAAVEPSSG